MGQKVVGVRSDGHLAGEPIPDMDDAGEERSPIRRLGRWGAAATAVTGAVSLAIGVATPPRSGPFCRDDCMSSISASSRNRWARLGMTVGCTALAGVMTAVLDAVTLRAEMEGNQR